VLKIHSMKTFIWIKTVCEFLQGCGTPPPADTKHLDHAWLRGLWWGALLGAVLLFCGQTSRFIYIDF
jgi:hypothetical protein